MPKTGSTSIQETLYYELRDPSFVYCGFGEVNGSFAMASIVGQNTDMGTLRQLAGGRLAGLYRQRMMARLQRCLNEARARGAALIISAEFAYGWRLHQHLWWRQFASDQNLDLRIIVYLRPPLDWLASALSEGLKYSRQTTHASMTDFTLRQMPMRQLDYSARIVMLGEVYGAEAVVVRPFLRSQLLEGCVVRDFCWVVGMHRAPVTIRRRNDSLSLEACQCLHLRNISLGRPLRGPLDLWRRDVLLMHLATLFSDRPRLRLKPAVLGDRLEALEQELSMLYQRHGITLPLSADHQETGLASLEPLLDLPADARERLAAAVGADCSPEEAMSHLERGLAVAPVLRSARQRLGRELRHALVGC